MKYFSQLFVTTELDEPCVFVIFCFRKIVESKTIKSRIKGSKHFQMTHLSHQKKKFIAELKNSKRPFHEDFMLKPTPRG